MVSQQLKSCNVILGSSSPLGSFLKKNIENVFSFGRSNAIFNFDLNKFNPKESSLSDKLQPTDLIKDFVRFDIINIYFIWYSDNNSEIFFIQEFLKIVPNVKVNIIFMSSFSVYGPISSNTLNEKYPLNPTTVYSQNKLNVENFLLEMTKLYSRLSVLILRIPCLVGKNAKHNFLSKLYSNISKYHPINLSFIKYKFNSVTDFTEVMNVSDYFIKHQLNNNHYLIFNLASSEFVIFEHFFKSFGFNIIESKNSWGNPPTYVDLSYLKEFEYYPKETYNVLKEYFNFD